MHRAFHYHVVRWLQEQGASCVPHDPLFSETPDGQ
jgi:hypothetical protein